MKNLHVVSLGRLGGLKGGKARAKKLTPKRRSEIVSAGAKARWIKHTMEQKKEDHKEQKAKDLKEKVKKHGIDYIVGLLCNFYGVSLEKIRERSQSVPYPKVRGLITYYMIDKGFIYSEVSQYLCMSTGGWIYKTYETVKNSKELRNELKFILK